MIIYFYNLVNNDRNLYISLDYITKEFGFDLENVNSSKSNNSGK